MALVDLLLLESAEGRAVGIFVELLLTREELKLVVDKFLCIIRRDLPVRHFRHQLEVQRYRMFALFP